MASDAVQVRGGGTARDLFVRIASRNEKKDKPEARLSLAESFRGTGKNAHDLIEFGGVRVAPFRQ